MVKWLAGTKTEPPIWYWVLVVPLLVVLVVPIFIVMWSCSEIKSWLK